MSIRHIAIVLLMGMIFAACSEPITPKPAAPFAGRSYDPRTPGVQITRIYYDENANQKESGSLNEFIMLQANDTVVTKKWTLDAGQGIVIPLRDTLFGSMIYYTRSEAGLSTSTAASFGLPFWIWEEHDTAKIFNDRKQLMSMLIY